MERNWLIRTTQNQILGPIPKFKVVEFLEKGALGLDDEVVSGNGYWFSLKEKELVDKYLYGDVPQGYNPISESKSVLAKRENPEKTTSINTAPANKTQVLKVSSNENVNLPKSEDLEFPDITMVNKTLPSPPTKEVSSKVEITKIPNSSDLEFPDLPNTNSANSSQKKSEASDVQNSLAAIEIIEKIIYPDDENLAYPEMPSDSSGTHHISLESSASIALAKETERQDRATLKNLETMMSAKLKLRSEPATVRSHHPKPEEKKLLHERKVKASIQDNESKEIDNNESTSRAIPEEFKKRNDNYLLYLLVILVIIILSLFIYYYRTILNKPLPV